MSFKKARDFKCDKCTHKFESFVTDDTSWLTCIKCDGIAYKAVSAARYFSNTVGKSPSGRGRL